MTLPTPSISSAGTTSSPIARNDTYNLYLAYHEGQGGHSRGSHFKKQWLLKVARKVQNRANSYQAQLQVCEQELQEEGWFFGWF